MKKHVLTLFQNQSSTSTTVILLSFILLMPVLSNARTFGEVGVITFNQNDYTYVSDFVNPINQKGKFYIKNGSIKKEKSLIKSEWLQINECSGRDCDANGQYASKSIYIVDCKDGSYQARWFSSAIRGKWESVKPTSYHWEAFTSTNHMGIIYDYICPKSR